MRAHTIRPVRCLRQLGICALLLGCGLEDPTEPSDTDSPTPPVTTPPTFTLVGQGDLNRLLPADLWVHGTAAYIGTACLDTCARSANTLWVWDVSIPAAPTEGDFVVVDGVASVTDVKIRADGTLGVISHDNSEDGRNGITLLDLSDPLRPQVITSFMPTELSNVHNTWIEGDYVYAAGGEASGERLSIIDISNPADPQIVADFYAGSSGAHDVYVRDGLAFVSHWDAGLVILDVGNGIAGGSPTNPVEVGRVQTEGGATHNAWYWPTKRYVFVGEESDRPGVLHVVDVSDLSNPVEVATFAVSGGNPHNFWLDEAQSILYVAWWRRGLKAIDVSGELVGRLDTQERLVGSISGYGGLGGSTVSWGAQLHNGLVYVSDVNGGLFIFRPEF